MHGRNAFRLTDGEREQLKTYVERGGMLFADSICASQAFTDVVPPRDGGHLPRQPARADPGRRSAVDDRLRRLRPDDRHPPRSAAGGRAARCKAMLRKVPPELEGIKLDDRWGVIFSRYDLSCALEKHDSLECRGYIREDAARIGLNVLLYSLAAVAVGDSPRAALNPRPPVAALWGLED